MRCVNLQGTVRNIQLYFYYVHWTENYVKQSFYLYKATG
mgnify:FL=1